MKKIILSVLFISITLPVLFAFLPGRAERPFKQNKPGIDDGIRFQAKSWQQAVSEAKKQGKLIFLDVYTSWCKPCKLLKNTTFTDKTVGAFFNKNFISITVDMEKGDGLALAKKYEVNAYPTLLIIDSEENVVAYTKGYMSSEQLIQFGKYGLAHQLKK